MLWMIVSFRLSFLWFQIFRLHHTKNVLRIQSVFFAYLCLNAKYFQVKNIYSSVSKIGQKFSFWPEEKFFAPRVKKWGTIWTVGTPQSFFDPLMFFARVENWSKDFWRKFLKIVFLEFFSNVDAQGQRRCKIGVIFFNQW